MGEHKMIIRVYGLSVAAALAAVACLTTSADVAALTFNPISSFVFGQTLSLTDHAVAQCFNGTLNNPGNQNLTHLDSFAGTSSRSCTGGAVSVNNTAGFQVASSGNASADLVTGTLKAKATGRSLVVGQDAAAIGSQESTFLYDTLTVNGNWSGIKIVELRFTVDGKLQSNDPQPNWQVGGPAVSSSLTLFAGNGFFLGNGGLNITQGNNGVPFIGAIGSTGDTTVVSNAVNTVFDPNNVQFTFSYLFPATTANRTFSFLARLGVVSAVGFGGGFGGVPVEGVVDFGNTGRFSLILPPDVTVSSESGHFLTAVPLPPAFALFALTAFPLLVRAYRRKGVLAM